MLVLTRRDGERVRIGQDIELTVVSVRGGQVRLGISAPRHIAVCRAELLEQVRDENRAAARAASALPVGALPTALHPGCARGRHTLAAGSATAARAGRSRAAARAPIGDVGAGQPASAALREL